MKLAIALLGLLCASAAPAGAWAKQRFANAYIAFDMPDGWVCKLEQTEWVCNPPIPKGGRRTMIIILTAKEVGHQDTLTAYQRHLNQVGRRPGVRVVESVAVRDLGGNFWVDGSYEGAEIPNYITRYWAGVKGDIAILVTFSVHRDYFSANRGLVDLVANSLDPRPRRRPRP